MLQSRKFRVSGRVQGVWFRASAQKQAQALGLSGWVRNCRNGDVEGLVSGAEAELAQFIDWLATGPELARVESVKVEETGFEPGTGFAIR